MKYFVFIFSLIAVSATAAAQQTRSEPANEAALAVASQTETPALVVDTAFVADAMQRGAILWDVRSPEEYRKGHLPGAVNIGDPLKVLRSENSEDFVSQSVIEDILGNVAIDPAKEIVVYGSKAVPAAYFALYTLQYFSAERAYVYHGGIEDWKAANQQIANEVPDVKPAKLSLVVNPRIAISTGEVLSKLERSEVQILDVRSQREFDGEDIRALRGGHIPGAINIPYERNWAGLGLRKPGEPVINAKEALGLKSQADLRAMYALLDPDKETIVYCQSGSRASVTAAVLKDLGFKQVRLYDSSWLAYGNNLEAPAEDVKFFNVGLFSNRMAALMKRVEELEQALAAIKENKK